MSSTIRQKLSIATVSLSGTIEDKLTAISRAGFDGIELFETDLITSMVSPPEIRRRCNDLGLSIELFQPLRDFEAAGPDRFAANMRRARHKISVMRELGAETLLLCSTTDPDAIDDDKLAVAQLSELADLASGHGIRVAYEALAWGRHVNTWDRAYELVRRADHPALGLCLDSFHFFSRNSRMPDLEAIDGTKLFHVQLSDVRKLSSDWLEWGRHSRLFPGQGSLPLPEFLASVLATGYRGGLGLEVFNDVYRQTDPNRAAADGMRSLQWVQEQCLTSSGRRLQGFTEPPTAPKLSGFGFVELSVGSKAAGLVAESLSAFGFEAVAAHRTRPVEMWRQGNAHVLVNSSVGPHHQPELSEVSAYLIHTDDSWQVADRAQALGGGIPPRNSLPGESDLARIAATDGLTIFFDDEESDAWHADFDYRTAPGDNRSTGLLDVDHVALPQPFDSYDECALFLRTVLGLELHSESQIAAPFGMMRSRLAGGFESGVRIVLIASLLRRGEWSPGVPDPQRVAFRCDDIFETAKLLRKRGAPVVDIPDNYYDDLDARLDLDAEVISRMRSLRIMVDRDQDGEFWHLCSPILGTRVYFEVIQRVGGYAGTGGSNAPVRMAAHRAQRLAEQRLPQGANT